MPVNIQIQTIDQILQELKRQNKENSKVEAKAFWYKDNTDTKGNSRKIKNELVKDLIALTNGTIAHVGRPGFLVIGFDESTGKFVGAHALNPDGTAKSESKLKDEITQSIKNYSNKPINFDVFLHKADEKEIIIIAVEPHPYLIYLNRELETPRKIYSKGALLYRENSIIEVATEEVRQEFEKAISELENSSFIADKTSFQTQEYPEIKLQARDILELIISPRDIKHLSINQGKELPKDRVYYEYYTLLRKGTLEGYLFVGNNVINKNIFDDFYASFRESLPDELEIFLLKKKDGKRVVDKKKDLIEKAKSYASIDINEESIYYIDDIVWNNTFQDDLLDEAYQRKDFIDQRIYRAECGTEIELLPQKSIDFFLRDIESQGSSPLSILFGSGGIGKTTFCDTLKYRIDNDKNIRKKVFYIKGERIVQFFLSGNKEVKSLNDLYELYRDDESEFSSVNQEYFKLNFIAGNIVVVIDAIEEIDSALNERFDLKFFFESLKSLHERFLCTKILITTREHFLDKLKESVSGLEADYYQLQGFSEIDLDEFLKERYSIQRPENPLKIKQVKDFILQNSLFDDGHITPLFVDWVCQIIDRPSQDTFESSKYLFPEKKIDRLLINLLQREISKQSLNIDVDGMFQLLEEIVNEYNGVMPRDDFDEYVRGATEQTAENYLKNPLFKVLGEKVEVKYDVLSNLIKSRFLHYALINRITLPKVIFILKDCYQGEGDIFLNLLDTLSQVNVSDLKQIAKYFISFLKTDFRNEKSKESQREKIRKSISALIYIIEYFEQPDDRHARMKFIQEIFDSPSLISLLCVYGEFKVLDFTELTIQDSYFDGYSNFHKSAFPKEEKAIFYSTKFKGFDIPQTQSIKREFFDSTCEYIDCNINSVVNINISKEAKKIVSLRSDMVSLVSYIDTSQRSLNRIKQKCSISYRRGVKKLLDELVSEDFLEVVNDKSNELYRINRDFCDYIPSIKLGIFPQELDGIINNLL